MVTVQLGPATQLGLREVDESDLPIFYEHQADEEACRVASFPSRDWNTFVSHWRSKILGDPTARKMAIVVGSQVAGNMLSWERDGRRFVGYWVGRSFWGQGIATAALRLFLQHETARPLY